MKKLLLILTLFVCCGCSNNTGETVVNISNSNNFELVRIGNHQYILWGFKGGICHYEDCDYCKQHRGY